MNDYLGLSSFQNRDIFSNLTPTSKCSRLSLKNLTHSAAACIFTLFATIILSSNVYHYYKLNPKTAMMDLFLHALMIP